ncbi:hypothetical protein SAMN05216466_1365 [Paraburkholderia phenazinium]|jgi:antitoxin (DNA-binding transcriptional repressor) of toxin-antitoxin stability system|uniref:Uncharacterized protein n=1 Tax=Paraburkholderia phenazinium TaxID=60549 RepID=A0A1G8NMX7_9BURK|nr:hypothetical protein SAMN05216466_1365 [Paraburkholderia phenazinium]
MSFRTHDVVPISDACSRLTELAVEVVAGTEKILTKNGSAYVALYAHSDTHVLLLSIRHQRELGYAPE